MEGDSETSKAVTPATSPECLALGGQLPPLGLEKGGLPEPQPRGDTGPQQSHPARAWGRCYQWAWKAEHPAKED